MEVGEKKLKKGIFIEEILNIGKNNIVKKEGNWVFLLKRKYLKTNTMENYDRWFWRNMGINVASVVLMISELYKLTI